MAYSGEPPELPQLQDIDNGKPVDKFNSLQQQYEEALERIKFLEEHHMELVRQKVRWTESQFETSRMQDQWHEEETKPRLQLSEAKSQPVDKLIKAVDRFVEMKQSQWGTSPLHKGKFSTDGRSWDMFRQFKQMLEQIPEELL